ncbi:hypothetical protein F2Q70_00021779 [Brassica cretica]|uniref:Aspartic peptidase DDI1-type domain-containing protein n=1 Tax=Brassica cretica TaxID=69181 RepID=A0A8S9GNF1_BRACR|nr:hypothetical protein F2Q70_00021779 [Brassica cretica]
MIEVLILKVDEMLRDEEGRTRNNASQLINVQDPFEGLLNQDPKNYIEELEDLVSRKRAFLYKILDDAEATREKEKNDKWDMLVESWHTKREDQIPRQLLHYIIVEGDKQHGSEELSRAEEAETSDPTSASITTTTSTSIDTNTATSIDDICPFRVITDLVLHWMGDGWNTRGRKECNLVDDPGKFVFPCFIAGVEFKEALCDSGSSVKLVSKAIVDELGVVDVEPSQVKLAFANSSMVVPYGTIQNLPVQEIARLRVFIQETWNYNPTDA